jgi:uncharacterized protein (DUF362 family)
MPTVTIQRIKEAGILPALQLLLQPFAAQRALSGSSVLIKPNLVEPEHYTTGQTTNPAVVEAIIQWCRLQGATQIAIGEGPSYFQPQYSLRECFTETGIAAVAKRQNVPWILFDEGPFRTFNNYSPRTPKSFSVSEHAFTWDHIINVPVPKSHYLTTVSIGMKNLKGFLKRNDKPAFHHVGDEGIHGSVTELNCLIRPSLTIVDCTAPVHTNKNFLLASSDIVACDAVTTSLMGLSPEKIRTIQLGYQAGLGEMHLAKIELLGDDFKTLKMNFEQHEDYLKRAFPRLTLAARQACSGCLIPFFWALQQLESNQGKIGAECTIIAGKNGHSPIKTDAVLFIGECTKQIAEKKCFLGGCPPTKEEMFEFLKKHFHK